MTAADDYPLLDDFASRPSGHVATLNAKRREARAALDEIERLRDEVGELKATLELRDDEEWREAMERRERQERDMYDPKESPC